MNKTKRGLPNTCARCGAACTSEWYAQNDDEARAGRGLCEKCANPHSPKAKKDAEPAK